MHGRTISLSLNMLCLSALYAPAQTLPEEQAVGRLEPVTTFHGAMPTGVTVSHDQRIFVNFPRWGDAVPFTVAEIVDGEAVAYPNIDVNRPDSLSPEQHFISVQSVVVDPANRLWVLDTGLGLPPGTPGAAKLVGIDLATDQVSTVITFADDVVPPGTYLNDVRFDLRRGESGIAIITDSSPSNGNGLILVDIATGQSWRRLKGHESVVPVPGFLAIVEGQPLLIRTPGGETRPFAVGSDGLALHADGRRLFYRPLSSRRLYSVSADALADRSVSDDAVAATIVDHGDIGFASDGLAADAEGRVYLTNYEDNAILIWHPDGSLETLVHDSRLLWPDTLCLALDGYLYIIANQLHRGAGFNAGADHRARPYTLFRIATDGSPVLLQ
ncbi:MAG: L-dopachrome tautomerase-related protein [Gemmatimonadales bacterium]|jgi:sugar lactone lactonase YvrE